MSRVQLFGVMRIASVLLDETSLGYIKLTENQVSRFKHWIASGARDGKPAGSFRGTPTGKLKAVRNLIGRARAKRFRMQRFSDLVPGIQRNASEEIMTCFKPVKLYKMQNAQSYASSVNGS